MTKPKSDRFTEASHTLVDFAAGIAQLAERDPATALDAAQRVRKGAAFADNMDPAHSYIGDFMRAYANLLETAATKPRSKRDVH